MGSKLANKQRIFAAFPIAGAPDSPNRLPPAAVLALVLSYSPSSALAVTYIPSVTIACDTCITYQDLSDKALYMARTYGWQGYTPPGYPSGSVVSPGRTLILVSSTKAPRSYAFAYQSHVYRSMNYTYNIYSYTVSPVTTYAEASDAGATSMDILLYKSLRTSGLPTINVPATDKSGNPLGPNSESDVITSAVSAMMPVVGVPGTLSTLPGLFNWTLFPSIQVVYQGKTYKLYEGDEVNIKFSDGSTLTLIVRVGGYGGSPGIFRVKSSTKPVSVLPPSTSQPGISLNTFDPVSQSYIGDPFFSFGSYLPGLTGVVVSGPIYFYVDVGP